MTRMTRVRIMEGMVRVAGLGGVLVGVMWILWIMGLEV
jgi:hypothetical protein